MALLYGSVAATSPEEIEAGKVELRWRVAWERPVEPGWFYN